MFIFKKSSNLDKKSVKLALFKKQKQATVIETVNTTEEKRPKRVRKEENNEEV